MAVLEVEGCVLARNARRVKERLAPGCKLCAMVKAEGYGHGMVPAAQLLAGVADWYGVATPVEGERLRAAGIEKPILVAAAGNLPASAVAAGLTLTVSGAEDVYAAEQAAVLAGKEAEVHLKVDTGMNRLGARGEEEVLAALRAVKACAHVSLTGCYTHFYSTEPLEAEDCFLRFKRLSAPVKQACPAAMLHAASSAGFLLDSRYHLDMVRIGILLYGYSPFRGGESALSVERAASLSGEVVLVREVKCGESVSYGGTYTFPKDARIAVVRLGYGDGVPRRLSNRGFLEINGRRCPIRGTVCMDLMMAELGDAPVQRGDRAYLFSERMSAEVAAECADTISYEILASLTGRVERNYSV